MALVGTISGDVQVNGNLSASTMTIPPNAVVDASVSAAAAIQATKVVHQHNKVYCQASGTTAVSEQKVVHSVYAAAGATIVALQAGVVVPNVGAATITVDLLKNGVSVLTATITIGVTTAYSTQNPAGFSSTSLAVGDVLEIKVVATAGGGTIGKGVFVNLVIRENPV